MAPQREWFEKDYYRILGVSEDASQKEIKNAYRKLSRKYHPDANPGDPAAEERFKEISAAYDVIGDPERRKEYDRSAARSDGRCSGRRGRRPGAGFRFEDLGDLGDVLGGLFGRRRPAGAPGHRAPGPGPRGRPAPRLRGAVRGITTTLH